MELDKRTLALLAVANQLIKDRIEPQLEAAYKAVRLAILDLGQPRNQRELKALEKAVTEAYLSASAPYLVSLTDDFAELSALEAAFMVGVSRKAIKAESLDIKIKETAQGKINQRVKDSVMHLHSKSGDVVGTWPEFADKYKENATERVIQVIRSNWMSQIDGVMPSPSAVINQVKIANDNLNKRAAETLVRTATNHFSTQGRLAFSDENASVIDREVPIVTFDSRVSDICIGISAAYGQTGWPRGKSPVGLPPYHPNCRTVIGYLLAGQKELFGTRQSVGGKAGKEAEEAFDKRNKKTDKVVKYQGKKDKSFKPEQIPARTPIESFLRDQPRWYVEEVLGKKKAAAFLAGDLNLEKLTDKSLKPKTLKQLGIE